MAAWFCSTVSRLARPVRLRSQTRAKGCVLACLIGGVSSGCNQDIKTPFPEGLTPLEANKASWPGSTSSGSLSFATGTAEDADVGEYTWMHARGYVQAPIEDVYEALRTPRVNVDRRKVNDFSVDWDVEPEYTYSYRIANTVEDIITVEYDVNWRHGEIDLDEDVDFEVGSRWQKTFGSEVIELMRGSVHTLEIDSNTTALELVLHQKSLQDDEPLVRGYLSDFYDDIQATTSGASLPEYETGT